MIIESARSPSYNADGTINLMVQFSGITGEIPFTASANDNEQHGKDIFAAAAAGTYGPVAPYVAPTITLVQAKAAKMADINSQFNTSSTVNVTVNGHTYQADLISQALLGQAITLAQVGVPLPSFWRDVNNVNVPITALSDLVAIASVIAANTEAAFVAKCARTDALALATTVNMVNSI